MAHLVQRCYITFKWGPLFLFVHRLTDDILQSANNQSLLPIHMETVFTFNILNKTNVCSIVCVCTGFM